MLDIKNCRELLRETGEKLSKEEIIRLRDDMYCLANIFLDEYFENMKNTP